MHTSGGAACGRDDDGDAHELGMCRPLQRTKIKEYSPRVNGRITEDHRGSPEDHGITGGSRWKSLLTSYPPLESKWVSPKRRKEMSRKRARPCSTISERYPSEEGLWQKSFARMARHGRNNSRRINTL